MKGNWTKYIIGYFLIMVFLCNGIVPELMILTGPVSKSIVSETMAGQEDANTERNTEEAPGDPRTEYLPGVHSSDHIHQAPLFFVANYVIPRDIAYRQAVVIPVLTPPPNVTII